MESLDKAILEGRPLNMAEMVFAAQNKAELERVQQDWDKRLQDDAALKARESQAKADLKRAADTEARAQRLLEQLSQKEVMLDELRQNLDMAKIELEQREKTANREFKAREEDLTRREKAIAPKEESLAEQMRQATQEKATAQQLQGKMEERLARLREIVA